MRDVLKPARAGEDGLQSGKQEDATEAKGMGIETPCQGRLERALKKQHGRSRCWDART